MLYHLHRCPSRKGPCIVVRVSYLGLNLVVYRYRASVLPEENLGMISTRIIRDFAKRLWILDKCGYGVTGLLVFGPLCEIVKPLLPRRYGDTGNDGSMHMDLDPGTSLGYSGTLNSASILSPNFQIILFR